MIVVDASVLANAIGDNGADGRLARSELGAEAGALAAPDLVDVETVAVLRKRWLAKTFTPLSDGQQGPPGRWTSTATQRSL